MNEDHRIFYSGVTRFVMEIAPRLAKRYEVTLVSTRSENGMRRENLSEGVSVVQFPMYRLPFPNTYIPRFGGDLVPLLNRSDLVFIQTFDLLEPLIRARRLKKPVLFYFHALDWEMLPRAWGLKKTRPLAASPLAASLIRKFWAWCASRVSHVCLPSPSYARYLAESNVKTPCSWIPPGIDTDRFCPAGDKDAAKTLIGISPENFVIGFVGRLWPDKNLDLLLDLFARLHEHKTETRLLIVGKGFKRLEQRAAGQPGVVWVGPQNDVAPYYQAMDLFCHFVGPNETSSFVTMEAMACSVPVIVNAEALPRDYVENGVDGFVIDPPNNLSQAENRILKLLEDATLRERMGARGREKMVKSFRWDETVNRLGDLIEHYTEVSS